MSLPKPAFSTASLHLDEPRHDINSNEPVAPSLQFASTYRTIHPSSDLARQVLQQGEESIDFQRPEAHIYSRYTSETRSRAEQVLSGLMVSEQQEEESSTASLAHSLSSTSSLLPKF